MIIIFNNLLEITFKRKAWCALQMCAVVFSDRLVVHAVQDNELPVY
jgi:hypothetical protein